jgi:hypothetical protein
MKLWVRADARRRVTGQAEAMPAIWLQITAKTARRAGRRTEPDLHLIKEVEQVTSFWRLGDAHASIKTRL